MNQILKQNIIIFSILFIIYYCNYTYLLKSLLLGLLNIFAIVITIFATLSKLYINSLYTVLKPLLSIILPKFWSILSLISLSLLLREIADILFVIADFLIKISNNYEKTELRFAHFYNNIFYLLSQLFVFLAFLLNLLKLYCYCFI